MEISGYDMHGNISKNEPRTLYPLLINRKFCTRHVTGREFRMASCWLWRLAGFGSLRLRSDVGNRGNLEFQTAYWL
jgi:hypothetical protein